MEPIDIEIKFQDEESVNQFLNNCGFGDWYIIKNEHTESISLCCDDSEINNWLYDYFSLESMLETILRKEKSWAYQDGQNDTRKEIKKALGI